MAAIKTPRINAIDDGELVDAILACVYKVGVRANNIPDELALQVLRNHIRSHYSNHTLEEMILAFDMAITGKLDVEVNCYENFSVLYLSSILNAYRNWASATHKQLTTTKQPMHIEHKEDTSDSAMQEWLDAVRQRETRFEFLPPMLFDWLERTGRIVKSNKEKWEYMKVAVNIRQAQLAKAFADDPKSLPFLQAFNDMKERMSFAPDEMGKLKDISKRLILKEYIDESN